MSVGLGSGLVFVRLFRFIILCVFWLSLDYFCYCVVMAVLWNRAGHYVFALWFLLLSIFFIFLTYSQQSQIGCLPYLHTWCGLSANLGYRSKTCCTRLAENTGRKKSPKIRHLYTTAQLCRAISSELRHISTIGKIVKQQYLPHMSYNMMNFSPLAAEIGSLVWGTAANFSVNVNKISIAP